MEILGLDHINIRTPDLESARRFYCQVLGLEDGFRPPFPAPGAWLYAGGRPVVHLVETDRPEDTPTGRFNHVAFAATGFHETLAALDANAIAYRVAEVPGSPVRQIFVTDPDGITVELNFASET
ncbi:MAG: VOC family protein [Rhodovibrionaceae bacterium]|nr:VOC family protein [Rhodovibrionaceae bacterium]